MQQYLIFDVGATFIKWARIQADLEICQQGKFALNQAKSAALMLTQIGQIIQEQEKQNLIRAIGLATAGTVVPQKGIILGQNANIEGYGGLNLKELLGQYTKLPIYIENDANAAILGELTNINLKPQNALMLTLGTDIGGGLVLNQKLYYGSNGMAGEIGFQTVQNDLRWGEYFSASGLIKLVKLKHQQDYLAEEILKTIDPAIVKTRNFWYHGLANGIANLIATLNLDLIIIGGALSEAPTFDLKLLKNEINQFLKLPQFVDSYELMVAQFGNQAALLGMASLIKKDLKKEA